jgi:menaquinol-cytochrome c reductase iron-sulfur subunit
VSTHSPGGGPHLPPPSLWPIGFAVGIACILLGLVLSWIVTAVGAVLTASFALLWVRDLTREVAGKAPAVEPERRADAEEAPAEPQAKTYPRSAFLEGATLGLGGVIGGLVAVPALGFAVLPSFTNQEDHDVELGPLSDFTEGEFVIATYLENPEEGEVSRRTVFVRNNGFLKDVPSFTVLFSRCVHLGCPVQPRGLIFEERKKELTSGKQQVTLRPTLATGFGCPCHGAAYDSEGNRTAGPPVRALDRLEFSIRDGKLWVGKHFSVSHVVGTGANARIKRYGLATPGVHVDGISAWLYPIEVPR